MKTNWIIVTALTASTVLLAMLAAGTVLTAAPALAQDQSDDQVVAPQRPRGRGMGPRVMGRRMGRPGAIGRGDGQVLRLLTAEQRAKAEQILKAAREEVRNLLTDEQKTELAKRRTGREQARRARGGDLGLTDEQKAKVAKIRQAGATKIAEARKQMREATEHLDKELAEVLTDEQMAKLRASRRVGGLQGADRAGRMRDGRGGRRGRRPGGRRGRRGMRGGGQDDAFAPVD